MNRQTSDTFEVSPDETVEEWRRLFRRSSRDDRNDPPAQGDDAADVQ